MSRKVPRFKVQSIARERIITLFEEAEKAFKLHPKRSDDYVKLAWKISTRNKARMPRELKRKFCRHCFSFWMPSKTVRVRTQEGHVVFTCLVCKHQARIQYRGRRK